MAINFVQTKQQNPEIQEKLTNGVIVLRNVMQEYIENRDLLSRCFFRERHNFDFDHLPEDLKIKYHNMYVSLKYIKFQLVMNEKSKINFITIFLPKTTKYSCFVNTTRFEQHVIKNNFHVKACKASVITTEWRKTIQTVMFDCHEEKVPEHKIIF